ncbi:hypothetical protein BKA24_001693 [Microbacterium marinum]|uniref:Uncharacterized protein n=1 Tax=Microbacterium marinum TaxID=421115 RepID=A0A7W7FL31_9MICO|nr:hypothetical protein [Microbacterium marinum]MBB4666984.1 hypothetical protein [Microbacterium marinum]
MIYALDADLWGHLAVTADKILADRERNAREQRERSAALARRGKRG